MVTDHHYDDDDDEEDDESESVPDEEEALPRLHFAPWFPRSSVQHAV